MLLLQYDAKPIEEIERKLDIMGILGLRVIKLNISNMIPSETTTLADILQQNSHVTSIGIGFGVANDVIELPKICQLSKSQKFYNCETVTHVVIHYKHGIGGSPSTPLPKNLEELVLDIALANPSGLELGIYLNKIITVKCSPRVKIINEENMNNWDGFTIPNNVKEISFSRRRNINQTLLDILKMKSFVRQDRGDNEVSYMRNTDCKESSLLNRGK